jgi:hypothetical protein
MLVRLHIFRIDAFVWFLCSSHKEKMDDIIKVCEDVGKGGLVTS